ncbi:MAG: FMN-binding protein [Treponema sp.]|nr:FMN-binding protein [Treponema sp.]
MNETFKLGFSLALYALVSCTVLAMVNNFTSPKIANNQIEKVNNAMKDFFPEEGVTAETLSEFHGKSYGTSKIEKIILAKNITDGQIVGGAVQVSGPTYDTGTILLGMQKDGIIRGLKFLKLTDSPGFGLKANDPTYKLENGKTFYQQFEGKNANDGFEAGKNFDAISGATITSNGIASLMELGCRELSSYLGGSNE